jgi:hypothetical protein
MVARVELNINSLTRLVRSFSAFRKMQIRPAVVTTCGGVYLRWLFVFVMSTGAPSQAPYIA